MTEEIITILPYGAYQFEIEIKIVSTEFVITEPKTIKYTAKCAFIVDKDEYNEQSKELLINAMRKYNREIIQLKKINSIQ